MASRRRKRRRSCEGKKRYEDKNAANRGLYGLGKYITSKMIAADTDQSLNAYHCEHCGGWHIGHDRRNGAFARSRKAMPKNAIR